MGEKYDTEDPMDLLSVVGEAVNPKHACNEDYNIYSIMSLCMYP